MLGTSIKISISKYTIYHVYKDAKIFFFPFNNFNQTKEKETREEVADEKRIVKIF